MFPLIRGWTAVQRTTSANARLGAVLCFVAGATNAGGFLAVGRYTSHMTGIVSSIADDLVLGHLAVAATGAFSLLAFVMGAMCTAVLVNWGFRHQLRSSYTLPLLLESGMLLVFGLFGAALNSMASIFVPLTVVLLCFMMGLQNAVITKISKADIRTTHITGLVTDLGIELGKLFYINRTPQATRVLADRSRLRLQLILIGGFLLAVWWAHWVSNTGATSPPCHWPACCGCCACGLCWTTFATWQQRPWTQPLHKKAIHADVCCGLLQTSPAGCLARLQPPAPDHRCGRGVTVSVVALPLAMAFAIASGLKPEAGLFTAIIAGFWISALGGSRVQIGGPAGAFIVIVYGILERYGLANLIIATALSGVLLFAMGLMRLGNLIRFIPVAVVIGFTNGIAVLIMLSQIKDFFGLPVSNMPADVVGMLQALAAAAPRPTWPPCWWPRHRCL